MTDSNPAGVSSKDNGTDSMVGRYRLLGPLGEGGMGVVYRAEDTTLGRHAALKFLPVHLAASGEAAARLLAEARAASALDHPHICTIYEVGEADDGRFFIAMACYEGESLAERLKEGPVSVEEAVQIGIQTASALEAAHDKGIVHRDIKPSNIFLTAEGTVKLLDFGVAKMDGEALTRTGDTLGTIQYMAPEQTRGVADARGDLWALGAVLYEMIVGERLFSGSYDGALLFDILYMEIDLKPVERAGAPPALVSVVARCLQREPEDRIASATALREALEGALASEVPVEIPAIPPASRVPKASAPAVPDPPSTTTAPATEVPTSAEPASTEAAPASGALGLATPATAATAAVPMEAAPGGVRRVSRTALAVAAAVLVLAAIGAWAVWGRADPNTTTGDETATLGASAAEGVGGIALADSAAREGEPLITGATDQPESQTLPTQPAPAQSAPVQAAPPVVYTAPPAQRPAPQQAAPPRQTAPPPQPATLVSRVGSGITVSVDGRAVNGSISVEPGAHTVVFRHPSYGESRRTVRAGPGESVALSIHFEAQIRVVAQLASGSGPAPFAAVWVNGRNTGNFTPTSLTLGPGRHTIELRRDGYTSVDGAKTVTVEPSPSPMTQSLSFRLASSSP